MYYRQVIYSYIVNNMQSIMTAAAALLAAWGVWIPLQGQQFRRENAIEPVAAILDVLRAHRVVALGTGGHNNEQGHRFVMALVRHPHFAAAGADLVVECGNARHQTEMDRFVAGEDFPYDELRRAWQDTTQPHAGCDTPIHEELYRAVRAINATVPTGRRMRVVLGDPPIDWNSSTERVDREKFMLLRDSHPAQLVQREVLAKGRRAVILYGQGHLQRRQMVANYDMSHDIAQTVVSLLERDGVKVFSVWGNTSIDLEALQQDASSWPQPSLIFLRGTSLGAADFATFFPGSNRFAVEGMKLVPIPHDRWKVMRMEEQFDALLYLGQPAGITIAQLSPSLCGDAAYLKMRFARLEAYGPKVETDKLRQYCATR